MKLNDSEIFDPVRGIKVQALPEEIVRQGILRKMLDLGYPKSLIAIEKEISLLPHVQGKVNNNRRADILCFGKEIYSGHSLYPLLMIECKAEEFSEKVFRQVAGYNMIVKAPFLAIANHDKIRIYWQEKDAFKSVGFLPSFAELVKAIKK